MEAVNEHEQSGEGYDGDDGVGRTILSISSQSPLKRRRSDPLASSDPLLDFDSQWRAPNPGLVKRARPLTNASDIVDIEVVSEMTPPRSIDSQMSELEPFSFLITTSPRQIAFGYAPLLEWLEGAINGDFSVSDRPFAIAVPEHLSADAKQKWSLLINALRNTSQLGAFWKKSCVVDSVLVLRACNSLLNLESRIWWLREAQSTLHSLAQRNDEGVAFAVFCLTLELFHRFVWARYTLQVHTRVLARQALRDMKAPESRVLDTRDSDWNRIFTMNDLGEGDESESMVGEDEDDAESDEDNDYSNPIFCDDPELLSNSRPAFEYSSDLEESLVVNGEFDQGHPADLEQEDDEEIPHVVPLFFHEPSMASVLDAIEGDAFQQSLDGMSSDTIREWPISEALEELCRILVHSHSGKNSRSTIESFRRAIRSAYDKISIPFLQGLGILSADTNGCVWSWDTTLHGTSLSHYVDLVYINEFRILSEEGTVSRSHTILSLLPSLRDSNQFSSSSRTQLAVQRVAALWHTRVESVIGGETAAQVDAMMGTLDMLTDEAKTLEKQIYENSLRYDEGLIVTSSIQVVMDSVRQRREQRMRDIAKLIQQVQDELHNLTSSIEINADTMAGPVPSIAGDGDSPMIDALELAMQSSTLHSS